MIRFLGFIVLSSFTALGACVSLEKPSALIECATTACVNQSFDARTDRTMVSTGGSTVSTGGSTGGMVTGGAIANGGANPTGGTGDVDSGKADSALTSNDVQLATDVATSPTDGAQIDERTAFDLEKPTDAALTEVTKPSLDAAVDQKDGAGSSPVPLPLKLPGVECDSSQIVGKACSGTTTCYSYCGPDKQGNKKLSCRESRFNEEKCLFSNTTNYVCYKMTSANLCPNGLLKAGSDCSEPRCQPCGSPYENVFQDANGRYFAGFCVCTDGKWSCGSSAKEEWPCSTNSPKKGC